MTNVAAGSYAISAKTTISTGGGAGANTVVVCTLDTGDGMTDIGQYALKFDTVDDRLDGAHADVRLDGSIVVKCRSTDAATATFTKIIAVKVDSIQRDAVTG